jgi:NAD+ synthase
MGIPLQIDPGWVIPVVEQFLRDEFDRTGFSRAVLGLSGGIDSSVAAALTVRALGTGNTTLVQMPHAVSSPASLEDSSAVARHLGVEPLTVDITAMTAGYPGFDDLDVIRAGNIMARLRMIVLYDLSAGLGGLVVGTSNKTEIYLGYGTLFGDTACALNPLGDLYKTQVRQLGAALGLPEQVLTKVPSADLYAGQTDEEELGLSYELADAVLYRVVTKAGPPKR